MPNIQHYSESEVFQGQIQGDTKSAILIQIADHAHYFVDPKQVFHTIHKFHFDDVESTANIFAIQESHARAIATILKRAKENDQDVVVHCYAGLCRSSAVAVCGEMIGFNLRPKTRLPNTLVKRMIMKELGLNIDETNSMFNLYNSEEVFFGFERRECED